MMNIAKIIVLAVLLFITIPTLIGSVIYSILLFNTGIDDLKQWGQGFIALAIFSGFVSVVCIMAINDAAEKSG